jgi:indole-3-glycerol phosphate synthase
MVQVIGNRLDQDSKRDGQKRGKAKGLSMLLEAHKKVKILVFWERGENLLGIQNVNVTSFVPHFELAINHNTPSL